MRTDNYVRMEVRHELSEEEQFVHERERTFDIKVTRVVVDDYRIRLIGQRVLKNGSLGQNTNGDINYGRLQRENVKLKNPLLQRLLDDYNAKHKELEQLKKTWEKK